MHTLDIDRPGMPDLQFALLVTALCTSPLTALNIPESLRVTIFDRCWVLIHESPPPRNPNKRVLDRRPWTEVTLEAIVETIRGILTEAGIRNLAWDHSPSESPQRSTPEERPLVSRFERLYPRLSTVRDASHGEAVVDVDLRKVFGELTVLLCELSPVLTQCALARGGKDAELVDQVQKGADVLRARAMVYLRWARYQAALSEGLIEADRAEESEFGL